MVKKKCFEVGIVAIYIFLPIDRDQTDQTTEPKQLDRDIVSTDPMWNGGGRMSTGKTGDERKRTEPILTRTLTELVMFEYQPFSINNLFEDVLDFTQYCIKLSGKHVSVGIRVRTFS